MLTLVGNTDHVYSHCSFLAAITQAVVTMPYVANGNLNFNTSIPVR